MPPMNENSTHRERFNMVMTVEERAMLQALAEAMEASESDVIRQLVQRAYARKFGDKDPGKPEPKYNSKSARGVK